MFVDVKAFFFNTLVATKSVGVLYNVEDNHAHYECKYCYYECSECLNTDSAFYLINSRIAENAGKHSTEETTYTMDTDMHAFNKNSETGAVYTEEDIHMTYTGGMTFTLDKDPDAEIGYPNIDSDYDVEILGVSGRYDEFMYDGVTAYLNLAMYNLPLDDEGLIIGAGDLLSIEIIAPHMDELDLDALCGTYTYLDMMTAYEFNPWTFMGGYFYDMYGFVIAAGTSLSVYDEEGNVTKAALTQDGTITISKADGPNYTVALDSHTQTGKHLTASWTIPLAGYVWDYISGNEPVAIESVALQAEPSAPSCCRTIAS